MYNHVIIRFSEIFLKSANVKRHLQNVLTSNLRQKLKDIEEEYQIIKRRNRIYIKTEQAEKIAHQTSKVAGVISTSPAYKFDLPEDIYIEDKTIELIIEEALKFSDFIDISADEKFRVRVRRVGNHKFSSQDIARIVGREIVEVKSPKVDLENPDKTLYIELRDNECFIFCEKVPGVGGLPYGTQGKVVALISEGIDSPAASFLMMKRGLSPIVLNFKPSKDYGQGLIKIIKCLEEYSARPLLTHIVNYGQFLERASGIAGKYTCVICKRTMLKVAEKVAKKHGALAIVTGDNLGQVASQTLSNISVVQYGCTLPIFRPLIGMDKEEITELAKEIGTLRYQNTDKCSYVPNKPSTQAKLETILEIEKQLNIDEEVSKLVEQI